MGLSPWGQGDAARPLSVGVDSAWGHRYHPIARWCVHRPGGNGALSLVPAVWRDFRTISILTMVWMLCPLAVHVFHPDPPVQAFIGSLSQKKCNFISCCHWGKEVSQRLRQWLHVLKGRARPSFISKSEPNHLKGGYRGGTFVNRWSGTMLLCLNAFTCFLSAVQDSVC